MAKISQIHSIAPDVVWVQVNESMVNQDMAKDLEESLGVLHKKTGLLFLVTGKDILLRSVSDDMLSRAGLTRVAKAGVR